jgi:hypothetical protein
MWLDEQVSVGMAASVVIILLGTALAVGHASFQRLLPREVQ